MHLTSAGRAALAQHTWPGKIRELANVLERAAILGVPPSTLQSRIKKLGVPAAR